MINTEEDSLLESLQAGVIALSMILFFYSTIKERYSQEAIASLFFMLLMFSFLIRELDVETFMVLPESVRYFLGKEGKDQTMLLTWGGYLILYLVMYRDKMQRMQSFLSSKEGAIWIVAGILLVLSQMMDKNIWHLHHHLNRYYEEFLELFSYLYILYGSWIRLGK
jgi:multisubunit Na+/H+ antiporter MnhB subunit